MVYMEIRHLKDTNEIQEGINALTSIFIDEYPYYSEWIKNKEKEFKSFEKEVLALVEENSTVGYAMIHNCTPNYFKINGIYVFPEFEGNGYASNAIEQIIEEQAIFGKHYALIQTRFHNNAVVHMFDKIGFDILGHNFHKIEQKDNWVAIYDIRHTNDYINMIDIAYKEYPGFEPMSIEEIQKTRDNYSRYEAKTLKKYIK